MRRFHSSRVMLAFSLALCGMVCTPVAAQDIPPALDPGQIGLGQVVAGIPSQAQRGRRHAARATPRQRDACARKARFRSVSQPGDPRVARLYALCRGVGL